MGRKPGRHQGTCPVCGTAWVGQRSKVYCSGLCYQRAWKGRQRGGDLLPRKEARSRGITDVEFFWSKVLLGPGCWEWTGCLSQGYGTFSIRGGKGEHERAHRFSWKIHFGPIPDGNDVLHQCDNKPCIRPDHLFLGTQAENMADAASKGLLNRGEKNGHAKLTAADVLAIRDLMGIGVRQAAIARQYGVHPSHVSSIKTGRIWGWL